MYPAGFKGAAKRLTAIDIAQVGRTIGVGEDEVRAVLEVETSGGGFDSSGRPRMLFEPHVFWRELGDSPKRTTAQAQGLAYPKWGQGSYPPDSYSRLATAIRIDVNAALRSASWGIGQIMGYNHRAAGYATAGDMVAAFCDNKTAGLQAMIRFIESEGLDDDLRRHDWSSFARGYNGPGYAKNRYHIKLAEAFARWQAIPDILAPNYPKIGLGARGEPVRLAQGRLAALGFEPGKVDGWYGASTVSAARAWQKSVGLKDDGIIGPASWLKLMEI